MSKEEDLLRGLLAIIFRDGGQTLHDLFGGDLEMATLAAGERVAFERSRHSDDDKLIARIKAITWAATEKTTLWLHYINHRRELAWREVLPFKLWFGTTRWHSEKEQLLINGWDVQKKAKRDFAMEGVINLSHQEPEEMARVSHPKSTRGKPVRS